jgi:methylglutaconyl-CoA hydratase
MQVADELLTELDSRGVLHITLNRPEVHNAFDDRQIQRLIAALEDAAVNEDVRVVVIAGNGKSFSAGGDINYMRRMGNNTYEENLADGGQLARLMKLLNYFPRPTIAKVQGAAMGGGVGLVCCCDYAVGSTRAKLALSEVKIGMVPATIAPYVVRTIGQKAARRLFMSGEMVAAERALQLGYLDRMVEPDELDGAVTELVDTLLQNSPNAVRLAKQLVFNVCEGDVDQSMIDGTVKMIADIRDSGEGREGLTAFLEKRPASWIK